MTKHLPAVLILAAAVAGGAYLAQPGTPAHADHHEAGEKGGGVTNTDITLEQARAVVDAALAKSGEVGTKMNVAVVDAGGNLKAFAREDGAWLGSIDIAQKKARTARYFDMPTGDIGSLAQPGGPLYNIEHSNDGLITFPGGLPITNADGQVIGAVGVSGSTVENDHTVAQAGVDALAE